MALFRSPTPRLAQKGSGGSPGVDFGSILDRNKIEFRPKIVQSIDIHSKTKTTKNGGRSAQYFLLLGMCFDRQSTGLIEITETTNAYCSLDLLTKGNGGNKFGAQTAGRHGGGYGRRHWIYK